MADIAGFIGTSWIPAIAWICGGVIVACFSKRYFDGESYFIERSQATPSPVAPDFAAPVPPGFATNKARYHFWFLIFFAVTFGIYLLIAAALTSLQAEGIRELAKGGSSPFQAQLLSIYPQLLAALMLSGLLPGLPFVSDILKQIRAWLHERARIPSEVQVVYQDLLAQKFPVTREERTRIIEHVGQQALRVEDFDSLNDDPWYKWAKTCQLVAVIYTLSRNHVVYKRNLARAELRYDLVRSNFDSVKAQVVEHRNASAFPPLVEFLVDKLLKQVAQLTACLICSSEDSDEEVNVRLSKLGVPRPSSRRYRVRLSQVLLFCVIFAVVIFFVALAAQVGLKAYGLWQGNELDGAIAFRIAIAATGVVYLPVVMIYLLKGVLARSGLWQVRGQFSERHYWPQALSAALAVCSGLLMLFAIEKIGLFDPNPDWERTLVYSILAGLSGWVTALTIDRKLQLDTSLRSVVANAAAWAVGGAVLFLLAGVICVTVHLRLALSGTAIAQNSTALWLLLVIPVEGALIGGMTSILASRSLSAVGTKSMVILNLREYLLPSLEIDKPALLDTGRLNTVFADRNDDLPEGFVGYLKKRGLVNEKNEFTEDGLRYLRRAAA